MKKIILLLILICLSQIVLADTLNKGESTSASGKTVTLVGVSPESVIVSVDGVKNIISLNDEKEINGINVKVVEITSFGDGDGSAVLDLSGAEDSEEEAKPVCGDGTCNDATEDKDNCCKDCGCEYGYGCENNKCVKAECMKDSECYATPKDFCSLDKCDPIAKKCTHNPISDCVVNDKCCPTACYYPKDPDCPATKINPNPQPKEEVVKDTSEETGDSGAVTILKEKEGIFTRIFNWFLGLFKK